MPRLLIRKHPPCVMATPEEIEVVKKAIEIFDSSPNTVILFPGGWEWEWIEGPCGIVVQIGVHPDEVQKAIEAERSRCIAAAEVTAANYRDAALAHPGDTDSHYSARAKGAQAVSLRIRREIKEGVSD